MSRLTLHTLDTAPAESRPFVEKAIANNGFLPNLIGVLANAPLALETYLTVSGINGRASLSLMEREVVQITAARIHGCDFCIAGHSAISLKKAGETPDTVRALQHGQPTGDAKAGRRGRLCRRRHRHAVAPSPTMNTRPSWRPATSNSRRWKWCSASAWRPCAISPTAWPAPPSIRN